MKQKKKPQKNARQIPDLPSKEDPKGGFTGGVRKGHWGQTRKMKYFVCASRLTGQSFSLFAPDPSDATSKLESYRAMERSEVAEWITELRRLLVS